MKTFIKVTDPQVRDELSKAGFSYISIEGGKQYVYEQTENLLAYLDVLKHGKFAKGKKRTLYALDTKLKF